MEQFKLGIYNMSQSMLESWSFKLVVLVAAIYNCSVCWQDVRECQHETW